MQLLSMLYEFSLKSVLMKYLLRTLNVVRHTHHGILCPSSCNALTIFASSCRFLMGHDITDLKVIKKKHHPF
jgi:hypothetical protein